MHKFRCFLADTSSVHRSLLLRALPWPVVAVAVIVLAASLNQAAELWPIQVATQPLRPAPLPLGTFTLGGPQEGRCPDGQTCTNFTVSDCTNVSKPRDGVIAYAPAVGTPRGMVVFFSGGGGTYFWSTIDVAAETLVDDVRAEGLAVVQVRWTSAWEAAEVGEDDAGGAHVACRPATAVDWIHNNLYADLDVASHGVGACGFCVTGTSGGASQSAYPLSHYGLEDILDAIVPVSGPTHSAMAKGCLRNPGEEDYWYAGVSTRNIDNTFGYLGSEGPCRDNSTDPYWERRWDDESVSTQGSDYTHPRTRVHLVIGENDKPMRAHSRDYYERLIEAGSTNVVREVIPGMPHSVTKSSAGLAAMKAALVGEGSPQPPPLPTLSINDVSVTEGDQGTTTATFTVSLSAASTETVTVSYATANGSATTADGDYVATNGPLNFAPSERTKTIAVVVNGDDKVEPDETFLVNLSGPTNATIADGQGVGTIRNDDATTPPPASAVTNGGFENGLTGWTSQSASTVSSPTNSGSGAARLGGSINASSGLVQSVTVPTDGQFEAWVRVDGADTSEADNLRVQVGSGRVFTTLATVTSGGTHNTFTRVTVDLSAYEGQTTKLRFLTFNDASAPTTFTLDDVSLVEGSGFEEPPPAVPQLSLDDVSVTEGDQGTTTATFTVSLSAASTETVTVSYATANGSATAGEDYVATNGPLSFAPSERTKTIAVTVNGDEVVEPDETFLVNLSGPTNATIADGQGVGTIRNDDDDSTPPPPSTSAVTNGDFANDLAGWMTYGTWVATPARSGPGAVRLGGSDRTSGGLVQQVTVPVNGQLEAWVWVDGAETTGADKLEVQVGSGRNYQTFAASTITSTAPRGTWNRVTADLSAYAGQTTNLRFLFSIDGANPTTFYLDDISLVAGPG